MCTVRNRLNHKSLLDGSVTAMCCSPVRHHLAVGLKNGQVKVFMGDPSQSTPVPFTIPDTKVPYTDCVHVYSTYCPKLHGQARPCPLFCLFLQVADLQSSGAVTALSYSRDGMKTAVAFQNGSVKIWKGTLPPLKILKKFLCG